jgi:hypothetical protein
VSYESAAPFFRVQHSRGLYSWTPVTFVTPQSAYKVAVPPRDCLSVGTTLTPEPIKYFHEISYQCVIRYGCCTQGADKTNTLYLRPTVHHTKHRRLTLLRQNQFNILTVRSITLSMTIKNSHKKVSAQPSFSVVLFSFLSCVSFADRS